MANSPAPRDLRLHPRHAVDLTGTAFFPTASTTVRVLDLSLGGARIALPLPTSAYDMSGLRALRIAQALQLRVAWRWSRGNVAGVQFLSPGQAVTGLARLIASADDSG